MKKILLIEDDVVLRNNTSELLTFSNYTVIKASNGKIGVELAIKNKPDIIVCDIMMPEIDGYGVLERLSKNNQTKRIPFVFLSAKTEQKDVRKGMNLGADDYITKPFNEEDFIKAIERRLEKTALLKEESAKHYIPKKPKEEIKNLSDLLLFFEDNGKQRHCKKNEILYKEGHNSNFIYLLKKGVVKCYKLDEQGKELTTSLFKTDDLFGYTSFKQNISHQETAIAIKEVALLYISKNQLKKILRNNPSVTLELIELLTNNIRGIKTQLLHMAYSSVNRKTAVSILKFAEKLNKKPEDPIKISRSDLANFAGIATETLIRTMSNFKKQGLIEINGRSIKILDLNKLKRIY